MPTIAKQYISILDGVKKFEKPGYEPIRFQTYRKQRDH